MSFTKNDLQQIEKIVDKRAVETEKRFEKNISGTIVRRLEKTISDQVGGLAAITKREFDKVGQKFDNVGQGLERLEKGQKQIGMDISNLEFIATEMVRRDEFLELKQRLSRIETKLGLSK